jgi:integral membrane protein
VKNPIRSLRKIGHFEAVSFLLLCGIAMPLKYIWKMPMAVKVFGWIHGILFIAFCIALARAIKPGRLPLSQALMAFVAALLPFGPWLIDSRLKKQEARFEQDHVTTA